MVYPFIKQKNTCLLNSEHFLFSQGTDCCFCTISAVTTFPIPFELFTAYLFVCCSIAKKLYSLCSSMTIYFFQRVASSLSTFSTKWCPSLKNFFFFRLYSLLIFPQCLSVSPRPIPNNGVSYRFDNERYILLIL